MAGTMPRSTPESTLIAGPDDSIVRGAARPCPCWVVACAAILAACGFPKPPDVAECTTASDCTSMTAPFCVAGACVSACASNADCAGRSGTPLCDTSSGACVGCLDATSCTADAPVCDATAHSCRGCDRDDECASGVCLEAEGRCAMDSELVFIGQEQIDNPQCSAAAPCKSFAAAFAVATPQRSVIHIIGGTYRMTAGIAPVGPRFTIDGSDTNIYNDQGVTFSATEQGQTITLSRVTLNPTEGTAVTASNNGAILLYRSALNGKAMVTGGSLGIQKSTVKDITCSAAGGLDIEHSTAGLVDATSCGLTLLASRFTNEIKATGGKVIIENNLVVSQDELQDGALILSSLPGSRFAFNTMVNFSGIDGTAVILTCNAGVDVSSNIFAWHSSASVAIEGCAPHHSLFDAFAATSVVGANRQADVATFFVDLDGRDLHLSATSPARELGEQGVVDVDIDDAPRPSPAGSAPDVGAYERP